jgi:hypothetical protein|tara:strand:+ start:1375 stop:1641 length:267 start_codon:yes stop_codon:yes gene_type:complete
MVVKGKADVNVEITANELVSALKDVVYSKLKLPKPVEGRVYVKKDRWEIQTTAHTTHSFEMEEDLGPADNDDVQVFVAFHTIAEFLKD